MEGASVHIWAGGRDPFTNHITKCCKQAIIILFIKLLRSRIVSAFIPFWLLKAVILSNGVG